MRITYLDGKRYSRAVLAASLWINEKQQRLNDINVYPVPDGDTGTNMASTMVSIAESIRANNFSDTIEIAGDQVAESALNGARGNSGAILAQFFYGLSEGFKGQIKVSTKHFADAVHRAVESSYEALSHPKEGTILTVIKDWGNHIKQIAHKTHDFSELMHSSLAVAKHSLEETPKKLKVLAKACVVDAGAQGFVYILEGVFNFIKDGSLVKLNQTQFSGSDFGSNVAKFTYSAEEITFRYCTEFFLIGEKIPTKLLRKNLQEFGDSLIVAGSEKRTRIHIHTDQPRQVFDFVKEYGEIKDQKMDDMMQQHYDIHDKKHTHSLALATDSSCDLPKEILKKYNIHTVPLRITINKTEYVDKVTIQADEFYSRLMEAEEFPKTSQPAPKDFLRIFQQLARTYDAIIAIQVSKALSGTYQSALTASKQIPGTDFKIIDSKSVTVGLALIVQAAAEKIEEGIKIDDLVPLIERWVKNCKIFISLATVEYLIRGGRLSKGKAMVANVLNLRPILSIGTNGNVKKVASAKPGIPSQEKALDLLFSESKKMIAPKFAIAHVETLSTAEWYHQKILARYPDQEIIIMPVSPALGAHAGPGAAAVAVMDLGD